MHKLHLTLSAEEMRTLTEALRKHPLAYVRERASALLQVSQGKEGQDVAANGLLQKRCKQTVYAWVHRYNKRGLVGLFHDEGRGRHRGFSPDGGGRSKITPGATSVSRAKKTSG